MRKEKESYDFRNGEILLIHKPKGWTSFQVINKIRFILKYEAGIPKIKVGHAGTLDPLATGLLIIATGKSTKQISEYLGQDKVYTGKITLGATTPSYDLETEFDRFFPVPELSHADAQKIANSFLGKQLQTPPDFSAIHINGKRAYEFARNSEEVRLNPRQIEIHSFLITEVILPDIYFRISCSKGTYIRTVASDFGKKAGSGACLSELCRVQSGSFSLEDAVTLDELKEILDKGGASSIKNTKSI